MRHHTRYSTLSRMRTSFGCSFCGTLAGATEESKGPPSLPLLDAAQVGRLLCSCSSGASSQSPLGERTLITCTASEREEAVTVLLAAKGPCLPMQLWLNGGLKVAAGTRGVLGSTPCSISISTLRRTHRQAQGGPLISINREPPTTEACTKQGC